MQRSELLATADRVVRAAYDHTVSNGGGLTGEQLAKALGLTHPQAKQAINYAAQQGWLEVTSTWGESVPTWVELSREGMRYVDALFGDRTDRSTAPPQVVYNVSGNNARINVQSHDASVNVVTVAEAALFEQIDQAIARQVPAGEEQSALRAAAKALQAAPDKSSRMKRYADFVQLAANHAAVLQPFFPALTQLLTG